MKAITLLIFTFLTSMAFAEESKRYTGPIIDMHFHPAEYSSSARPRTQPETGFVAPPTGQDCLDQIVSLMERHNIVLAAVMGGTLEWIGPWRERFGDRQMIAGLSFSHPTRQVKNGPKVLLTVSQFRDLVSEGKLQIFGEMGSVYGGLSPSDPSIMPYYAVAESLDVPVGIHTGGSSPGITDKNKDFRLRYGDPLELEDLLVAHPKLRVYMMHAGAAFYRNAVIMMRQYPRLYADIAVLTWLPSAKVNLEPFLRMAKEYGVLDRVMFGTDLWAYPDVITLAIENVQSLDFLTYEEKKGIFYDNAAHFLRLNEEVIAKHHEKK
jgi:uncharacterized protein